MRQIIHPTLKPQLHALIYRFRFLGVYIAIGLVSLFIEMGFRTFLLSIALSGVAATLISIAIGITFAFWANTAFNFRVPRARWVRAFYYFVTISTCSALLQWLVVLLVPNFNFGYEINRVLISGMLFMLAYLLHRRYSFRDFKRVGVAIYANSVEDISLIHRNIGQYPDFIHVDILDSSFSTSAQETKLHRMETIRAHWPSREIHTHIMSRNPSRWLMPVLNYSDVIYIHAECDEQVPVLIKRIHDAGKKAGLALTMQSSIDQFQKFIEQVDAVLLLSIKNPGFSGQRFETDAIKRINKLNSLPFRNRFRICVDGGVDELTVQALQVEDVVSGSSVLNNVDPKRQILRLQTSVYFEKA